jgi:hypothetical protein
MDKKLKISSYFLDTIFTVMKQERIIDEFDVEVSIKENEKEFIVDPLDFKILKKRGRKNG